MNYILKTAAGIALVVFAFFAVMIIPDLVSATMSTVSIGAGILSFIGGVALVVSGIKESRKTDRLK